MAVRLALSVSASGNPNDPGLDSTRREILQLVREGIAINPHYRKITPMVGDEVARWGDWQNATWIWDSVLGSRPNIVAILGNAARGYSWMGQQDKALEYLARAKRIQPNAPTVRSLEVILLARTGQEAKALEAAKAAFAANIVDYDLANSLFILSWRARDYALARQALARRVAGWPQSNAEALVQLGRMTAEEHGDPAKGIEYYRRGLAAASPVERAALLQLVPGAQRAQVLAAP
jgi:tetratricopeptide (TPR) repeat protein